MKENKRKKISILNILFLVLILTLITSLVFKNRENFKNIFTKKNKIKAPQASTAADLNIGDIVYYNHEYAPNKNDEAKQSVIIPRGDSANPGLGNMRTFNAKYYNTTWRVWDKLSDGRVMLVSNQTLTSISTYGAVGHIWWEHNAHKVSSIFGYGEGADTNATKGTKYKVGSGIDNAPDMTEGDKGDWKIGEEPQDKINISGARSLTLPEVEKKLGITDESIKNRTTSTYINYSSPGYGDQTTTSMPYVVQRDIDSANQKWENKEDRKIGKAKNNSYKMTDRYYWWKKNSIPATKYKDILFNGRKDSKDLATNTLNVYSGGSYVDFGRGIVNNVNLESNNGNLVISSISGWKEIYTDFYLCVVVYLKSNIKYFSAGDNAWDIYEASSEDKNVKLKVLNLSSTSIDKIGIKASKVNTKAMLPEDITKETKASTKVGEKYEYNLNIKKYSGQKRDKNTTGDDATFSKMENKYNVEITGIPSGYDFKILGKTGKQIDLDTDTNLEYELVIYPKAGKQVVQIEYDGSQNDPDFAVTGNIVIKSGELEVGKKENVTLRIGKNLVEVDNVDLFNKDTNTVGEITDIIFIESNPDENLHIVEYDEYDKKLYVIYVSPNKEITVSVLEDSKKYLTNITEIKLKLVGGEEKNIILKPTDFTTKLTVPERDETGNVINYSLQKAENISGYYLSIDGFNVSLKPILKLPFTGTELSSRNIAIISLGLFGIALAFRFRKKLVLVFKEYKIMK